MYYGFAEFIVLLFIQHFVLHVSAIDYCAGDPCKNGECVSTISGYTCYCDAFYQGENCDEGKLLVYWFIMDGVQFYSVTGVSKAVLSANQI